MQITITFYTTFLCLFIKVEFNMSKKSYEKKKHLALNITGQTSIQKRFQFNEDIIRLFQYCCFNLKIMF